MWSKSYSQRVKGIEAEKLWKVWIDVNQWPTWQDDIESAKIEGKFEAGNTFAMRPKGGPNVKIRILRADKCVNFTDLTKFPLAEMTGSHDFIRHGDEIELKTTMTVKGPLSFLWARIVAKDIVASLPQQTERLVERAKALA